MRKYHIKDNGEPGLCVAVVRCKYNLGLDEHFDTPKEAVVAYEVKMSDQVFGNTVSKGGVKTEGGYTVTNGTGLLFTGMTEDYGIEFKQPNIEGSFLERNSDSTFYRFDQMGDIFEDYEISDVRPGYALNGVKLNTVQQFVSDAVVNSYAEEKNPFRKSFFKYDEMDENESFPIVAIIDNEPYIIDGNHRFAAAKVKNMSAFAAVVLEFNEDGSEYYDVSPEEFNRRFHKPEIEMTGVPGRVHDRAESRIALSDVDGTIVKRSLMLNHAVMLHERGQIDLGDLPDRWQRDLKNEKLISEMSDRYRSSIVGMTPDELDVDSYIDGVVSDDKNFYSTLEKLNQIKEEGSDVVLISGSPSYLVDKFASKYGFRSVGSNYHLDEGGRFTGGFDGMFSSDAKRDYIQTLGLERYSFVMAYGDTPSDMPLFENANYSTLVEPHSNDEYVKQFAHEIVMD